MLHSMSILARNVTTETIMRMPLAEAPCDIPTVYADTIAAVEMPYPGIMVRHIYCEVQSIGGVNYRVPVLRVVRPSALYVPGLMMRMMMEAREVLMKAGCDFGLPN